MDLFGHLMAFIFSFTFFLVVQNLAKLSSLNKVTIFLGPDEMTYTTGTIAYK